jgi:hypothetical protein
LLEDPQAGCVDVVFASARVLTPAGQVALEDYARVLAAARHGQVRHAADGDLSVVGVHLCAPEVDCSTALRADLEAFAAELADATEGGKLGWS